MHRIALFVSTPPLLLLLALILPVKASAQQVKAETLILENGMKFLLVPRHEEPNVLVAGWVANVGSVNERPGITGISHFFEHMMFKGTTTIGTKDAKRDKELMAEQTEVHGDLLRHHLKNQYKRWKEGEIDDPWDAKHDTPEMIELRAKLTSLQEEQKNTTIVKDEFDQIYTREGGNFMNASTSEDLTFYFVGLPSNKFELWSWMESDRLRDSVFREFYLERDVVHEERRLRTESTPTGIFQEQFDAMFWESSPYSWPVIGWTSDLNSYTRAQAEDYFATYYCPNNLIGIVVGDFEVADIRPMIELYFSRLQRGNDPPPVVTLEMKQLAEKRMIAEGDCQPQVEVRYHTVPFGHPDGFVLDLMSEILNGRTGRLYKSLVDGEKTASVARASQDSRKYAGAFSFSAETKGEGTPEQLEMGWQQEIKRLQDELVGEDELQKVKNRNLADSYRRLQSNFFLLIQIGMFESMGGWEFINEGPRKQQQVTAKDIQRVANQYFDRTNKSVAIYYRKEGSKGDDPELMAIPSELRGQVKQAISQFQQMPPEALQQLVGQFEGQLQSAPKDMKPALEFMLKKAREILVEKEEATNES